MPHLENWSVALGAGGTPYTAPELIPRVLQGSVTGHKQLEDGTAIRTTSVESIDYAAKTATTKNCEYTLGTPDADWLAWCKANNIEHSHLLS